jgi:hypothetical protein
MNHDEKSSFIQFFIPVKAGIQRFSLPRPLSLRPSTYLPAFPFKRRGVTIKKRGTAPLSVRLLLSLFYLLTFNTFDATLLLNTILFFGN